MTCPAAEASAPDGLVRGYVLARGAFRHIAVRMNETVAVSQIFPVPNRKVWQVAATIECDAIPDTK